MELPKIGFVTRLKKWVNNNRVSRIHLHYKSIEQHIKPRRKNSKAEAAFFKSTFRSYHKKAIVLVRARLVAYFFLYASIAVNVIKLIPYLDVLVPYIQLGQSVVSTTLLIIIVFLITLRINLYIELLNECLSHLICLYYQEPDRDSGAMLTNVRATL